MIHKGHAGCYHPPPHDIPSTHAESHQIRRYTVETGRWVRPGEGRHVPFGIQVGRQAGPLHVGAGGPGQAAGQVKVRRVR